jgi:flagella basal body P-ring formation protein FlgA
MMTIRTAALRALLSPPSLSYPSPREAVRREAKAAFGRRLSRTPMLRIGYGEAEARVGGSVLRGFALPRWGGGNANGIARVFLLAAALFAASTTTALAQQGSDTIASPVLHASVTVADDLVRIGDLIDNAGSFAQIAVYRAPDLGTTGTIPTAQVLTALRAHQVIGVDTHNIKEVTVTRLARTVDSKEIESAVAHALEHRNGLGDAANLSLTFDRDVQDLKLDASNSGAMQVASTRFEPRSGRFDVTFEIANEASSAPTRLRFTGTAIETVEAAVLTRNVDRSDLLKSADIVTERRTKAEVGSDAASREQALGMQMRRPMHAGQPLRAADLVKPDLVQRDQSVTVIYESPGLYLTTRGKALDSGTEGDVVNVINLQSKRTVTGVVTGRGQVTIDVATPKPAPEPEITSSIAPEQASAPVAKALSSEADARPRDDNAPRQSVNPRVTSLTSQVASPVTPAE